MSDGPNTNKIMAGAMALGMICALYRARALPESSRALAREILQESGDLARLENELAEFDRIKALA